MNKTFNTARANLAHSQSLMDAMHAPQEMAQPSPEMPQQAPEQPQQAPQTPVEQPAPISQETPTAPDKTTQKTTQEIVKTVETGFGVLDKTANTLTDTKKKPKILDRIKARLSKPKE